MKSYDEYAAGKSHSAHRYLDRNSIILHSQRQLFASRIKNATAYEFHIRMTCFNQTNYHSQINVANERKGEDRKE